MIYKQNEQYVEYTVDNIDEFISDYLYHIFPRIILSSDEPIMAEVHTGGGVFFYKLPDYKLYPILACDINKIILWYPNGFGSLDISFEQTKWVNKITYIYTDYRVTTRIPDRLLN